MKLNCPNCNTLIPASNINIQSTIAHCPQCNEVFNFTGLVPARKPKSRLNETVLPAEVSVFEYLNQTIIQFPMAYVGSPKRRRLMIWFYAVAIVIYLLMMTLISPSFWVMMVVVASSFTIIALTNNIRITMHPMILGRVYWPIPWREVRIDRTQIVDLEVAGRHFRKASSFRLDIVLKDGTRKMLIRGHPEAVVQFVAEALRHYLVDEPMVEAYQEQPITLPEDQHMTDTR